MDQHIRISPYNPIDFSAIAAPEREALLSFREQQAGDVVGYTIFDDSGPIAAMGFRLLPDNEAYAWALLSDAMKAKPFALHRLVKRKLPEMIAEYSIRTLYCDADIDAPVEIEWLRRLGFRPLRIMENAYGTGQDFVIHEWICSRSTPRGDRSPRGVGHRRGSGCSARGNEHSGSA